MAYVKYSAFITKSKRLLSEFVANGGQVENLSTKDYIYSFIKNSKILDDEGKPLSVEEKFEMLGYPRKSKKVQDVKQRLIDEINEYIKNGGSFHVPRKELPFFEHLHSYATHLKNQGLDYTHDYIMKEILGFRKYSDIYFRCKEIKNFKYFKDENGFVDDYRKHEKFNSYIKDISQSLNVPIYMVITLLADEKLKRYNFDVDKIKYTQRELENYAYKYGTFEGIKTNDPKLYDLFTNLVKYYSDGTEQRYSKIEWLQIFGLSQYEHNFQPIKDLEIDIEDIMTKLREENKNRVVNLGEIDTNIYRLILRKAVAMGISVSELFKLYDIKCNGISINRLSKIWVDEVPYFEEMQKRRNEIMKILAADLKQRTNLKTLCKEDIFEIKLMAVKQVYEEYKEKLENYLPKKLYNNINEETTL